MKIVPYITVLLIDGTLTDYYSEHINKTKNSENNRYEEPSGEVAIKHPAPGESLYHSERHSTVPVLLFLGYFTTTCRADVNKL